MGLSPRWPKSLARVGNPVNWQTYVDQTSLIPLDAWSLPTLLHRFTSSLPIDTKVNGVKDDLETKETDGIHSLLGVNESIEGETRGH